MRTLEGRDESVMLKCITVEVNEDGVKTLRKFGVLLRATLTAVLPYLLRHIY